MTTKKAKNKPRVIKAVLSESAKQSLKAKEKPKASLEAQERLAEILNDSPRLVSLNGSQWEIKALRMGTQWLIAQEVIKINKAESATMGDILKQFAVNIPAVLDVLTLALLNDKRKIYEDGDADKGYSQLFKSVRDTLEWECDVSKFAELLLEVLQMLDVSFFIQALDMLQIFRARVTEVKRIRIAE